jgi:hypothetical protein
MSGLTTATARLSPSPTFVRFNLHPKQAQKERKEGSGDGCLESPPLEETWTKSGKLFRGLKKPIIAPT